MMFDFFGWSVALDGYQVLIGAPFDNTQGDDVGQAYLFIPEPATFCLVTLGGMVLLLRRRRAG